MATPGGEHAALPSELAPTVEPSSGLEPTIERGAATPTQVSVQGSHAARPRIVPSRSAGGRYVLERELACGGMGRISVATDTVLDRHVALKELIQPSAALAARFQRELALTARLQHPAIVSIHDAGRWPSGEPFYVMRLVSGASLEATLRDLVTIEDRLALLPNLTAAADALAYAHAHHVIHRDLKPANILIGEFGETVVIDWGLAKDLQTADAGASDPGVGLDHEAEGATAYGSVLGTPAFMAPEQALGEPVDARADVYALGAVLYYTLCGAAPFAARTVDEVLAQVIDGPPPPLRERAPGLPPDLVTIVEKAMSRSASDRYATAGELAAELKRFQQGQLVRSHRYSAAARLTRWVRRHRAAAAVALAALVVVAGIGVASLRRIVVEEDRAQSARELALQHRAHAEDLMQFLLQELHDRLVEYGKLELLEIPARKALAYYAVRPPDSLDDLNQLAVARQNLGDVLRARGESMAAQRELAVSLALRAHLFAVSPADADLRRGLATAHERIGDVLADRGELADALRSFEVSLGVLDAGPGRDVPAARVELLMRIGRTADRADDIERAAAAYEHAHEIAAALAAADPADRSSARRLMMSHQKRGTVRTRQGRLAAALVEFRTALALSEQLLAQHPDDVTLIRDHALNHDAVARSMLVQGNAVDGIPHIRAGRALVDRLIAREPENAQWQRERMISHLRLGETLTTLGDGAAVILEYEAAIAIAARLVEHDPTNRERRRELGILHNKLGHQLSSAGDLSRALQRYRAARAIAEQLAADAQPGPWRADLALTHRNVGDTLARLGHHDEALAELRIALATFQQLASDNPRSVDAKFDLAGAHHLLGTALRRRDRTAATAELRAALAIMEELLRHDSSNARWRDTADALRAVLATTPRDRAR